MSDLFYYEPIKGPGAERRDELGNFAPYRSQPHRGCDWGFKNGSQGKAIYAIRSGKVTFAGWNEALGHTLIIKSRDGIYIEYNHMDQETHLQVGDLVVGGSTLVGRIGCTGSALSQAKAYHLHASASRYHTPHAAPRHKLIDLFKEIDKSTALVKRNARIAHEAKVAKAASLAKAIAIKAAKVPAKPLKPKKTALVHSVKRGESYWSIAKKYKMDFQLLQKLNDNKALYPGDKLRLK